jgi:hypothetical protein
VFSFPQDSHQNPVQVSSLHHTSYNPSPSHSYFFTLTVLSEDISFTAAINSLFSKCKTQTFDA